MNKLSLVKAINGFSQCVVIADFTSPINAEINLPDTFDLWQQFIVPFGSATAKRWIAQLSGMAPIGRRGDLQNPGDRLDPKVSPVLVNEGVYFSLRSSSA